MAVEDRVLLGDGWTADTCELRSQRKRGGLGGDPRRGEPLGAAVAHHVTMRLVDDRVIAHTAASRRIASRVVLKCGESRGLIAFRIADTHAHVLLACTRRQAGAFARATETGLRFALRLPVPFEAARIRPVTDQRHLTNAFRYVLRQEERHGIAADSLQDGSSLSDLLGLRTVGSSLRQNVAAHLPRLRREALLAWLQVVDLDVVPLELVDLADAAAASLALPELAGRDGPHRAAQSAAVQVATHAGASRSDVVCLTGVSSRTFSRLVTVPAHDEALVRAVELQLRLRAALRRRVEAPLP